MRTHNVKDDLQDFKDLIQKKWGKITDQELSGTNWDKTKIVEVIQQKYGEAKESIEKTLDSLMQNPESTIEHAIDVVMHKKDEVVDMTGKVSTELREEIIKSPLISMAISFSLGFLLGKILK